MARNVRMLIEHPVEIILVHDAERAFLDGADGCGAGAVIQQCQFTEVITGALGVHDELLAILVTAVDFDPTALNHKE